jgi:ABC-type uncharacterized transport system permease subunit
MTATQVPEAAEAPPASRTAAGAPALVWLLTAAGVAGIFLAVWAATGIDPLDAVTTMVEGALGGRDRVAETLVRAVPLAVVGLGAALAIRGGVINVGGEGQMAMGAVAAVLVVGAVPEAPIVAVWFLALAAGAAGGAAWAVVPAVLAARRSVPEILSTLLVNFATVSLLTWLLTDTFLHDPDPYVITAQGEPIGDRLEFPLLLDGTRLHLGVVLAAVLVVATAWWARTPGGLRLDLFGANRSLAAQAGIRPVRTRARLLLVSAAFAGVAGAIQLFGLSHRLSPGLTGGVGYTGVLVAVLGRNRPLAVGGAALAFAALSTGGEALERAGAPREVVLVLQAVLVAATAVAIRPKAVAA